MRLIYTPRSHFARKVRLLLGALDLEAELVDAGNAADADPALFGPNPLMKVPTLVDGDQVVFESDHIAAYLVRHRDPEDRFGVLTANPDELNARAVMNGAMGAGLPGVPIRRDVGPPGAVWPGAARIPVLAVAQAGMCALAFRRTIDAATPLIRQGASP